MIITDIARSASHHLTKLGSKKLSEFIESHGPIEISDRYSDDKLMGLARIVIGQQLSNQAAKAIWNRLYQRFSTRHDLITALQDRETPNTGLSNAKKRSLSEILMRGDDWINAIAVEDESQRQKQLLAIWGLGPWSVAMWELFVLKNPDVWSDGDLILNRISTDLALDLNINQSEFVASAAPFRSYLALYCWKLNDSQ